MIKSVKEGVAIYKAAYKVYLVLLTELKARYGDINPLAWSSSDILSSYETNKVKILSDLLYGMAIALEFSREEKVRIDQEAEAEYELSKATYKTALTAHMKMMVGFARKGAAMFTGCPETRNRGRDSLITLQDMAWKLGLFNEEEQRIFKEVEKELSKEMDAEFAARMAAKNKQP